MHCAIYWDETLNAWKPLVSEQETMQLFPHDPDPEKAVRKYFDCLTDDELVKIIQID